MNSEEGMSLAKMAVGVLLVVLVIGAVVGVVYAAYGWFNSGTSQLGDQVTAIGDSTYTKYDDQTVTGVDVLTALKTYRNSDITVVVANKNCNGGTAQYPTTPAGGVKGLCYCAMPVDASSNQATAGAEFTVAYNAATGKFSVGKLSFDTANNSPFYNTNFSPTTQSSSALAYVKQTSDWYANLIYSDETGEVCGLLFRQMN